MTSNQEDRIADDQRQQRPHAGSRPYHYRCRGQHRRRDLLRHAATRRRVRSARSYGVLAKADYVLIPALIICLGLIGVGLYRRRVRQR